jgi:uncharacterized protein YjbJ (UPF0337 family)
MLAFFVLILFFHSIDYRITSARTSFTSTTYNTKVRVSAKMTDNNNPSLIGGHAQYVKGAVEETIGNVTGSQAWKDSGAHDKQEAVEKMRAANQGPSDSSLISGSMEKKMGNMVGCEGMVHNGEEKEKRQ